MDVSPSVEKMIMVLKQELKARGIRRRDVAARLGVSEITVKRYLGGRGLPIAALEKLASVVDLDLLSLAVLAQEQSTITPELTKAQQAALGKSRALSGLFIMLIRGWTPAKIEKEFELSPQTVEAHLARLQDLGLIRRTSAQGIKILARPHSDQKGGGQLSDLWRDLAREFLSEIDLRDEHCEWFYYGVRLGPRSVSPLRELIKRFMADVRALAQSDAAVPPDDVKWYRLFIGAQPRKRPSLVEQSW